MSGRKHRQKGDRHERSLVNLLKEAGFAAERTPSSGAKKGSRFGGGYDVTWPLIGRDFMLEAKHHGNGFTRVYRWLAPVNMLILKADSSPDLAVLPLSLLIEIAQLAEQHHARTRASEPAARVVKKTIHLGL